MEFGYHLESTIDFRTLTVTEWFYSDRCNFRNKPVKESTHRSHISLFKNHIANYIGEKPLSYVTNDECNNIIQTLKAANVSFGLVNGVYAVITQCR